MLGLGVGLNKQNKSNFVPFKEDAVQITKALIDGVIYDKIGVSDRTQIVGSYFVGNGTLAIRVTDYLSTALTYVDHTTGTTEDGTTDENGDFLIPANGVRQITIDGYIAYAEGGNQDTEVEFINSTGVRIYGQIQNTITTDRVASDNVYCNADMNGYTIADGSTHYYDSGLTSLVPSGKLSQNYQGKSGFYISDGESGSLLADSDYTGEVKTNLIYCDDDGTPNVSGLYLKQSNKKYSVNQADKTLTNQWYNHTDADILTYNTILISTLANVDNQQQFINKDNWKQILYDATQAESNYTTIMKYMKLVELLVDINNSALVDSEGTFLYALLEGITVV